MSVFSKQLLSGTPASGRKILIVQTTATGDLIHTAASGAADFDEIWLYANNIDGTARKLTVEWGGIVAPADTIEMLIPAGEGLVAVIPGWPMNGGLVVRAFAELTNVISVGGFVNRIVG